MNILSDPWLTVIRANKNEVTISLLELTSQLDTNPIVEILAPRPDIKNALYSFLIGLLHVANTPIDNRKWAEQWQNPPDENHLKGLLSPLIPFFEIDSNGPAFMQDFDLREGEEKPIASLFIEAPGAKTVKDNLDHFIKREHITGVDPYWAAAALYTMQSFAPAGGVGHRVGVRGGGPLTTLVLPKDQPSQPSTLWQKLWMNVLPKNEIAGCCKSSDYDNASYDAIFPWLKPTKFSEGKGTELLPGECNPLHIFFAMPRRIRLCFRKQSGICSLTGKQSDNLVTSFITKNYGNNYSGPWVHPLNAYRYDPKKTEEPPLSIKGQLGGVHYRHWLSHTFGYDNIQPAAVVNSLQYDTYKKLIFKNKETILWSAGYDMDNMKARSWHESTMPYYIFPDTVDSDFIKDFTSDVTVLVDVAKTVSDLLRSSVRKMWFKDPSSNAAKKADFSFLDDSFTQNTEKKFYEIVKMLKDRYGAENSKEIRAEAGKKWLTGLQTECMRLFDKWCMSTQDGQKDLHKVFDTRRSLENFIRSVKEIKKLKIWYENETENNDDVKKTKKKRSSVKGGTVNE